jgi:hypothetical protein
MKFIPDVTSDDSNGLINSAQQVADEILRGVTTPYEGGRRIWMECQLKLEPGDHRLDPFVYWSSEYEETSSKDRQVLCENAISAAASELLRKGSAL